MNAPVNHPVPLLEPDVLRSFVAIAETGSFTAAANQVFRTPSAVSMQIKKLEEVLGKPLFVRDSRSVTLTADGEMLIGYARRLLALNREAVAKFIAPDISGEVRLGAPDDVSERFLPDMLRRFSQSHPGITVNVVVENTNVLIERVARGGLDLAMITCEGGVAGDENAEVLHREPLAWACLRGGCAASRDPLPVSVWEEGCVWRKSALDGLAAANRNYRISFQSAYISGQKAAILADLAVAPMPVSAISDPIMAADASYGLPELGDYALGLVVVREPSAAAAAAADHLRASFAQRRSVVGAAARRVGMAC
ncbi:MAG: LysR substrate-binding domain-containing protein [Rhizobiaceae bacterium]